MVKVFGQYYKGEFIFSRAQHDCRFTSDRQIGVDGGQGFNDTACCIRVLGDATHEFGWFAFPDYFSSDLYEDWRHNRDKFGLHDAAGDSYGQPIPKKDWPTKAEQSSLEWTKNNFMWGTNGINGDQPTKYVNLINCETDHLKAILDLGRRGIVSKVIGAILKDRGYA